MGQGEDISGGGAAGGQMELQAQAGGGFFSFIWEKSNFQIHKFRISSTDFF